MVLLTKDIWLWIIQCTVINTQIYNCTTILVLKISSSL